MRYVVIMAGGAGTRLWPLSRQGTPKQLLPLIQGRSLLRLAFERALRSVPAERIWVVTGATHVAAVARDLPEIPDSNILGEPVGRDSLNAVAWPAAVLARLDPDAVIAQLTADQVIEPLETFTDSLATAFAVAEADPTALVTLGVVPTNPHTGYGYLHLGDPVAGFNQVRQVSEFVEKPALEVAEEYLVSGEYWWNAGMFVWRAATVLEQLRVLLPDTWRSVLELAEHPDRLNQIFPELMRTSVDYGIMEPVSHGKGTAQVVTVALPVRWSDVGGYLSLAELLDADTAGNAGQGRIVALDSNHNIVVNQVAGSVVALLGVDDLVVVQTPGAILVAHQGQVERIRELVGEVSAVAGPQFT